jgi:metal-responsive CopG/Arc/MetJ family transcriptional regulator
MAARKAKKVPELKTRTSGGLIRRVVYLPPELAEQLQDLARRRYRAESDLIREAVREYVERQS